MVSKLHDIVVSNLFVNVLKFDKFIRDSTTDVNKDLVTWKKQKIKLNKKS